MAENMSERKLAEKLHRIENAVSSLAHVFNEFDVRMQEAAAGMVKVSAFLKDSPLAFNSDTAQTEGEDKAELR